MELTLIPHFDGCRLVIGGSVTQEHSARLEASIISTMRRFPRVEVDLGGVNEIDRFAIRLIGLMQSLGGEDVRIVAASPAFQDAAGRFPEASASAGRMH